MDKEQEQLEATNRLLLDMVKNQKKSAKSMLTAFIVTICCYTAILISMVVGFFWYESQFETTETVTETVTETTITQEVSGEDSTINNVEGNQYNDNAVHNEEGDN